MKRKVFVLLILVIVSLGACSSMEEGKSAIKFTPTETPKLTETPVPFVAKHMWKAFR